VLQGRRAAIVTLESTSTRLDRRELEQTRRPGRRRALALLAACTPTGVSVGYFNTVLLRRSLASETASEARTAARIAAALEEADVRLGLDMRLAIEKALANRRYLTWKKRGMALSDFDRLDRASAVARHSRRRPPESLLFRPLNRPASMATCCRDSLRPRR
jgi:hypothetical protein